MRLTLLIVAAIGIAVLGRVPEVHASCASPSVGFLPADGQTVPPHPTIYVFDPHYGGAPRDAHLVVEGAEATIETVSKAHAYEVLRVRVLAHEPGLEFTVRWRSAADPDAERYLLARYRIGDTPPNQARVVGVGHHKHEWTCSYANTIRLELEGTAIAYRLDWQDGSSTIVPADDRALWPRDADPPGTPTVAELGHLDCTGHSVDSEALARPRAFAFYALFTDGSELRLGGSVAQLGEAGVRLPTELVSEGRDALDASSAYRILVVQPPPLWSAALGALGAAIALAGAALLGRRRRREHLPRQ